MSLFKNQHPEIMMSATQVDCFIKYLNPSDSVFEWGSGGSTYNFCKYVNIYHSVEHDSNWYDQIKNKLNNRNIKNVNYDHVPNHQIISLNEIIPSMNDIFIMKVNQGNESEVLQDNETK